MEKSTSIIMTVPSTNNVVQILGSSKQGTAHFLEGCSGCSDLSRLSAAGALALRVKIR